MLDEVERSRTPHPSFWTVVMEFCPPVLAVSPHDRYSEGAGKGASHSETTYRCCLPALAEFAARLPRSSRRSDLTWRSASSGALGAYFLSGSGSMPGTLNT